MEQYLYTCLNCSKQFKPTRRRVQKYCSNSCRTSAFNKRKNVGELNPIANKKTELTKIEKISWQGAGNAAVGILAVKLAEHVFIPEASKPATKADLKNLESKLTQPFFLIRNMPLNAIGQKPYFDVQKGIVFYK